MTTFGTSSQASHDKQLAKELEETLRLKQEEYEQAESQFHAEHEEEVRALRQQKQHILRQNEELKSHYQQLLDDQDKQVRIASPQSITGK